MSAEPDYKVEDLVVSIKAWIMTIYQVLITPISGIKNSLNTGEVGGRKLNEIRDEVHGMIDEHINAVYPHKPTLSNIFHTTSLHQHNFTDGVVVNWTVGIITVPDFKVNILGKEFDMRGFSRPLLPGTNYLVVEGTGDVNNRSFNIVLSDRPKSGFLKYTVAVLYRSPNSMIRIPIYRMD